MRNDHNSTLNPDSNLTAKAAEEYIQSKNLQGEFEKWLEGKTKEYGVKEVIFDGYTPSGKRRYVDNTLENVSRLMKGEGRNGATGWSGSFSDFAARLMPSYSKLEEIRTKKGLLTNDHADVEAFREKWGKVYTELGMKCQPDAKGQFDTYGMERLSEAATQKNPQQYLKEQYGVELSDADAKRLNEMIEAIKKEYPAMYFETKYERPVMFNEFASAVVPKTLKESTKEFLRKQGLTLYEYDKDIEGDRQRAFDEASSGEGIRFQFVGEKGAENADKLEEADRRMDNLRVAREMEKSEKDAKSIKIATGWERGADGKWRYEIPDVKYHPEGDAEYEKIRNRQRWSKELDELSDKVFEGKKLSDKEEKRFDELAQLESEFKADYLSQEKPYLTNWVENDELFASYPELKQTQIIFTDQLPERTAGYYSEKDNTIVVNTKSSLAYESIIAHEVQHAIQRIEGFARGGSLEEIEKDFQRAKEEVRARSWAFQLKETAKELGGDYNQLEVEKALIKEYEDMNMSDMMPDEETRIKAFNYFARGYADRSLDDAIKRYKLDTSTGSNFNSYKEYQKLAGEVESRNVQERMYMTSEERRKSLAAETEDVSREDQIFLYGETGINEMGSRVDKRMADVGQRLKEKDLTEEQQAVIDVYSGKADRKTILVKGEDGAKRKIEMQQGNERNAGTKHSLFRHYDTKDGVINAEDLLRIPEIIGKGERKINKGSVVYTYSENGVKYTVVTDIKSNKEVFHDFYSNKKGKDTKVVVPNGDTQSARTDDVLSSSGANLERNTESGKNSEGNLHYRMGDSTQTFAERQRKAVENRGTVMPGLNEAEVKVVEVPKHSYKGTIKEATERAIESAKAKYVPNGEPKILHYNNYGTSFDYVISKRAIQICLSPTHQSKSVNKGSHLALADHLDEIINNSIEVEEHPDYTKDEKGVRGNGINSNALMHRFYGAVTIDGKQYRVITLMREDSNVNEGNGIHSYEVQTIEVLNNELPSTSNGADSHHQSKTDLTYRIANLLSGVEKSYDKGKKLLEESKSLTDIKYRTSSEIDAEYPSTSATDPKSKTSRATEISEHLNTPVRVITSEKEMEGLSPRQKKAKGWYNTATGEVVVVVPNNADVADVENTVLHEVIGHDGIRDFRL